MVTMTSAARRERAKIAYDDFLAQCPTRGLFGIINDKWVGLLLAALADGPQRYGQLAAKVAGISPKMLTQTLRTLERDGLISRSVTPSVPVRVDYELTTTGQSLMVAMLTLKTWAESHFDDVQAAREKYDAGIAQQG